MDFKLFIKQKAESYSTQDAALSFECVNCNAIQDSWQIQMTNARKTKVKWEYNHN